MNKFNRSIDETIMIQSKERSIEFVMNEINREPKKQFSFNFTMLKAVPALLVVVALVLFGILSNGTNDNPLPNPTSPLLETSNTETLAELSYITGNIIVSSFTVDTGSRLMKLSDLNETEFEDGIIEFNAYFDMLRVFMEEDPFSDNFLVEELTEGDYSTKLTFMVDGTTYIFLINLEDTVLTGKLEVNNLILDVVGKLEESNDELNFEITATNGQDYIEIKYQVESDDEIEKTYELTTYINGVTKEKEIIISIEDNQIKVKLKEGNNEYELEKEFKDEQVQYKLQYHIGLVEGEAIIFDAIDELGNTIFTYQINEEGHETEIDVDKNDDEDELDDEQDTDQEDEDDELDEDTDSEDELDEEDQEDGSEEGLGEDEEDQENNSEDDELDEEDQEDNSEDDELNDEENPEDDELDEDDGLDNEDDELDEEDGLDEENPEDDELDEEDGLDNEDDELDEDEDSEEDIVEQQDPEEDSEEEQDPEEDSEEEQDPEQDEEQDPEEDSEEDEDPEEIF